MEQLSFLKEIKPLHKETMSAAKRRMDALVKPIGSLGKLEEIAIRLSGVSGTLYNHLRKKAIVLMCADNGVCEEGVASAPQIVTATQTVNFIKGITGVGVLARFGQCDLKVVDIGIKEDIQHNDLINCKIRKGTWNIANGEAMTRAEAINAIRVGVDLVSRLKDEGYDIIGTGEMGIGNTTSSSSVLIALTRCSIDEAVGRGAGLTDEAFERKKNVVREALDINKPNSEDPIDVLQKVGGFDIAGLVGVFLGAAYYRIPVVVDGFITAVAALLAYRINDLSRDFMFPSHISIESGYNVALSELKLEPILDLGMRLGEGSGCPLAFNIIEASTKIMNEMATFEEGDVDLANYQGLWEDKKC